MKYRVEELESIVRSRICAVCTDRTPEGICGMEGPDACSLFQLFPLVAQAILATESDRIEDYVQAIRENVCSVCADQRLDGVCERRDEAHCALDAYLVPVVDAIEEATGRSFDRRNLKTAVL